MNKIDLSRISFYYKMNKYKKDNGQYFTISNELQSFVFEKVNHKL
jgi:hypothetical protein